MSKNRRKSKVELIVVIIVIALLGAGTLAMFAYQSMLLTAVESAKK